MTMSFPAQMVLPAYINPIHRDEWRRIEEAAAVLGWRLTVILNPHNGPGTEAEAGAWVEQIGYLRTRASGRPDATGHGSVNVYGYVHTCYGNKKPNDYGTCRRPGGLESVEEDVDRWHAWYGGHIDGVFVDECSTRPEDVRFYVNLTRHVSTKKGRSPYDSWKQYMYDCLLNYGVRPERETYDALRTAPGCHVVRWCFHERRFSADVWDPTWVKELDSSRVIGLFRQTCPSNWRGAIDRLRSYSINNIYVTDGDDYNRLPPYFEDQVQLISSLSLPN